ncbi:TOPRIM nucleotidyl transferase/hydrolase domain-containing protein [Streptomyces sp. NPDC048659]|uniref:TOPRIM nucleotidyl transferase/hydrolase domain-containing protein n=1 Tax=Streptomyces sp. NPDC048659 TaxID=3155489 RepID=UPI00342F7F82
MDAFREAVVGWAAGGGGDGLARECVGRVARDVGVRGVVLVEGDSDVRAVEAVARRGGWDLGGGGVCVVPMGGAMSVGRFVGVLGPEGLGVPLFGLCDERERGYFERAWERGGVPGRDVFVCSADLEDEFVRVLGVERVVQVVREEGEGRALRTFLRQPDQQGRDPGQQLRRFFGTKKGRKIRYGQVLVEALGAGQPLPGPLLGLFDALPVSAR